MSDVQFEELVSLALRLKPLDKVRLVERVVSTLEDDLSTDEVKPTHSLLGLWADLKVDISSEDIDEARREIWANFPREDI